MIFRQVWLGVAILLLLAGIGMRQPAVAGVGALVLLVGSGARLWSRLALERVSYRRILHDRRAFVGEEVEVGYSVANRKALPIPWLEVRESVPDRMPPTDAHFSPSGVAGELYVTRSTSLAWYERVRWRHTFLCGERGYFHFGPTRLRSGDMFGIFPTERDIDTRDHLTVLPRVIDLPALGLPAERPFGEARSGSRIFEDPSRIVGVRDYRPGDPLKRIDWKATARRSGAAAGSPLQSRIYEPSSSLHLLVTLNVDTFEHVWEGYDPLLLERAITVAGSIAAWAESRRYAVGLLANSSYPGSDRPVSLPPGRDPDQVTRILEALAMVSPFTIAPLEEVIEETVRRLPLGSTVVVVAAYLSESLAGRINRLRGRGHPVVLVWAGDEPPPHALGDLRMYDVSAAMRKLEREWAAPPSHVHIPTVEPPAPAAPASSARDEGDPVQRWARPPSHPVDRPASEGEH